MKKEMRFQCAIALILLLGAIAMVFPGCSGDDNNNNNTGPTDEQLDQTEAILAKQQAYHNTYQSLLSEMDSSSALDSLTSLISADTDVESAVNVSLGVNIVWKTGLYGGIVTKLKTLNPEDTILFTKGNRLVAESPSTASMTMPKGKKMIFFAPCYSEFALWDNSMKNFGNTKFAPLGYDTFEVYKDNNCTLARLCGLSGGNYGVVRISSHGQPWPSQTDISDVYLITGEIPTRESIGNTWVYLDNHFLGTINILGENRYTMSSAYFAVNNDFADKAPLVSLGFCFSALGHWLTDLKNTCHAGAVVGYDWSQYSSSDDNMMEQMLTALCDTHRTAPLDFQTWHAANNPQRWDPQDNKYINMNYAAQDSFVLWSSFRISSIFPTTSMAGSPIIIRGKGFGNVYENCRVMIGTVYGDLSNVSDTFLYVYTPSSLPQGTYQVKAIVNGVETNSLSWTNGIVANSLHKVCVNLWTNTDKSTTTGPQTNYESVGISNVLGNFSANNYIAALDTTYGSGNREVINVRGTVNPSAQAIDSLRIIRTLYYPYEKSTDSLIIKFINVPIAYYGIGGAYYDNMTLQCYVDGTGTCSYISEYLHHMTDSLGARIYTLTSYDCDTNHVEGYISDMTITFTDN